MKGFARCTSAIALWLLFTLALDLHAKAQSTTTTLPNQSSSSTAAKGDSEFAQAMEAAKKNNLEEAIRLIRLSADLGNGRGMEWLGLIYSKGIGVTQDLKQAREWYVKAEAAYEKAAAAGDVTAAYRLGRMDEVAQHYEKAREFYEKSIGMGSTDAMVELGEFYRDGKGVPQDYQKARVLFEKAAAQGDGGGLVLLADLLHRPGRRTGLQESKTIVRTGRRCRYRECDEQYRVPLRVRPGCPKGL